MTDLKRKSREKPTGREKENVINSFGGTDLKNPWEEIALNDYENHMSLDGVYQLQTMNEMMKEQLNEYKIKTVIILGVAGGNGLEHIDREKIEKVYGVDVNQKYLDECVNRYPELAGVFKAICADLLNDNLQLPDSELIIANLLIEYIGYECFQNIINSVKPRYVSCIIQINTDKSFVSDSPYLQAFARLDEVHHQIDKTSLINAMNKIGYIKTLIDERELPNGKKLSRIDFIIKY